MKKKASTILKRQKFLFCESLISRFATSNTFAVFIFAILANFCLYNPIKMLDKSYLFYETIASKNVSSKAQVFFLFCRKVMFLSEDMQLFCIFNYPVIYQICHVMVNISTLDRVVHFEMCLLN